LAWQLEIFSILQIRQAFSAESGTGVHFHGFGWWNALAPIRFPFKLSGVFHLTKREKQIVAFVLVAFLVGWTYQQWQTLSLSQPAALSSPADE